MTTLKTVGKECVLLARFAKLAAWWSLPSSSRASRPTLTPARVSPPTLFNAATNPSVWRTQYLVAKQHALSLWAPIKNWLPIKPTHHSCGRATATHAVTLVRFAWAARCLVAVAVLIPIVWGFVQRSAALATSAVVAVRCTEICSFVVQSAVLVIDRAFLADSGLLT